MTTAPARSFSPVLAAALLTACGDFLLWPAQPGLSLGLFFVAAAAAVFTGRPAALREPRPLLVAALLLASAGQTAVELSFSNLLILTLLLLLLLGEVFFPAVPGLWPRVIEAGLVYLRAPLRWWRVWRVARQVPIHRLPLAAALQIGISVVAPALILAGVFTLLLGQGNAILAQRLSSLIVALGDLLTSFSPLRLGFWLLLGTFALACTCPAGGVIPLRIWALRPPLLPGGADPRFACWRSWCVLGVLNALFFVSNTIDASYLWVHHQLPAGVSYSAYVHQGVAALVAAVLLSAFVLVALLQQTRAVTGSRLLRALSLLWIAQNLVLLGSVLLRLRLYVETYDLSTERVYVAFFLVLVAAGFALLAWRVLRDRDLTWLVSANLVATGALFFVVQFCDVARWVAEYNVTAWQANPPRVLDTEYLVRLGPSAWPALRRAADTPGRSSAEKARLALATLQEQERGRVLDWRSRQLRRDAQAAQLLAQVLPPR